MKTDTCSHNNKSWRKHGLYDTKHEHSREGAKRGSYSAIPVLFYPVQVSWHKGPGTIIVGVLTLGGHKVFRSVLTVTLMHVDHLRMLLMIDFICCRHSVKEH